MQSKNKFKKLIITAIAIFAIILGVSLYFIITNAQKTAVVNILVAPSSSTISINGKKYTNGNYKVRPGSYQAVISKDGFESQTIDFEATEAEETFIYTYLEQTDGDDWYENNEGDNMIRGSINAYKTEKKVTELYNSTPIISILPITVDYYTSNYSEHIKYTISYQIADDNSKITLLVTDYTGGNYNRATNNLSDRGYNIKDYEINYIDKSSDNTSGGHAF